MPRSIFLCVCARSCSFSNSPRLRRDHLQPSLTATSDNPDLAEEVARETISIAAASRRSVTLIGSERSRNIYFAVTPIRCVPRTPPFSLAEGWRWLSKRLCFSVIDAGAFFEVIFLFHIWFTCPLLRVLEASCNRLRSEQEVNSLISCLRLLPPLPFRTTKTKACRKTTGVYASPRNRSFSSESCWAYK